MDVLSKLRTIMDEKKISEYKLAKMSNVSQSTINSMFKKYNNPSIYTLESICKALNITMSDFFYEPTEEVKLKSANLDKDYIKQWYKLNMNQKEAILLLISLLIDQNQ